MAYPDESPHRTLLGGRYSYTPHLGGVNGLLWPCAGGSYTPYFDPYFRVPPEYPYSRGCIQRGVSEHMPCDCTRVGLPNGHSITSP